MGSKMGSRGAILILLCLLCPGLAWAQADAMASLYRLHSELDGQGADLFGFAVATAGDIDGDGFDDVLVGAPGADVNGLVNAGSAFVFSGKGGFLLHRLDGQSADEEFGFAVWGNSDVNGDGVPDVLVGAPGALIGGVAQTGRAYLYSGATFELVRQYVGRNSGGRFGQRAILPGDLDGDGYGDLVISAPLADLRGRVDAGKVYVISGRTPRLLFNIGGLLPGEQVGASIAPVGDANRDGVQDLIVASPEVPNGNLPRSGRAAIVSGHSGQIHRITGFEADGLLGASVAGSRDLDGDGAMDVIVGAPGCSAAGRPGAGCILAYSGATGHLLMRLDGEQENAALGTAVDFFPDVNGDGVPEILAGLPTVTVDGVPEVGEVVAYSGSTGQPIFRRRGTVPLGHVGASVSCAGDVDGDGNPDLVVGSPATADPDALSRANIYMWSNLRLSIEGETRLGGSFILHVSGDPGDGYLTLFSPYGGPDSSFRPIPFPVGPGNASAIDVGLEGWRFSNAHPPLSGLLPESGRFDIHVTLPIRPHYANRTLHAQVVTFPGLSTPIDKVSNVVTFVVLPPN